VKSQYAVDDSAQTLEFGRLAAEDAVVGGRTAVACEVNDCPKRDYRRGQGDADTKQVADNVLDSLVGPGGSCAAGI